MIIVIIAGGSGTRLWPLSTPDYPKHLLKINGSNTSLLQQTYQRAKTLSKKIFVVTEASHVEHVTKQLTGLPKDHIICEPGRRGTANCIIAALAKVADKYDPDEVVAFMHSDHFVRDKEGFANSFNIAETISAKLKQIVLLGVEPDYPSTAFGYIEKGELLDKRAFAYRVKSFKEKPDFNTASAYLRSGKYLWNCGYFVGSLNTFVSEMKDNASELYDNFQALQKASARERDRVYLSFETEAIDIALIEKVPDLLVIPASFDWMDLGSFGDLHKAIGSDEQGNYMTGHIEALEVENSFIHNSEEKPIAVIGLDNVVVVNTKDGILVARKDLAQEVGEVSKKLYK